MQSNKKKALSFKEVKKGGKVDERDIKEKNRLSSAKNRATRDFKRLDKALNIESNTLIRYYIKAFTVICSSAAALNYLH